MVERNSDLERRQSVLQKMIRILEVERRLIDEKGDEVMKSKANVDGPWQSKQPDRMIEIEWDAQHYKRRAMLMGRTLAELQRLQVESPNISDSIQVGSIFVWDLSEKDGLQSNREEIVVLLENGGQDREGFRFLTSSTPLAMAAMGKKAGDVVDFRDIQVKIKEVL